MSVGDEGKIGKKGCLLVGGGENENLNGRSIAPLFRRHRRYVEGRGESKKEFSLLLDNSFSSGLKNY